MPGRQSGWRWCSKCGQLFFGPGTSGGVCAGGDEHDGSASGNYVMRHQDASLGESGWRWCKECATLFFRGTDDVARFGTCPAGDVHNPTGSGEYALIVDQIGAPPPYGQVGWQWCMNCEGLLYVANADWGICPAAMNGPVELAGHVTIKSPFYSITTVTERRAPALDLLDQYVPSGPSRQDSRWTEIIKDYTEGGTTCGFLCHWLMWRLGAVNRKTNKAVRKIVNRSEPSRGLDYVDTQNIGRIHQGGNAPFRPAEGRPDERPNPGDLVFVANLEAGKTLKEHVFVFLEEEHDDIDGTWQVWWRTAEAGQNDRADRSSKGEYCKFKRRRVFAGKPFRRVSEKEDDKPGRRVIGWLDLDELTYTDPPVV